jgi:hypothetical protein
MLHSMHRTYLKPTVIKFEMSRISIIIKNIGPGIALNISLKSELLKNPLLEEKKGKEVFERKVAEGSFELKPNEEKEYYFDQGFTSDLKHPITICWRSVTGEKQKSKWIYSGKGRNEFILLGFFRKWKRE